MRVLSLVVLTAGGALALLALAGPAGVAAAEALQADWSAAGGAARLAPLGRGILIALATGAVSVALGGLLATGIICAAPGLRGALRWAGLATLLGPPYVYAYAWSLVLLRGGVATSQDVGTGWWPLVAQHARATWCLATWTAPLSAALLLAGWNVAGRPAFALAAQDASVSRGAGRVLLRALLPWLLLALGVAALIGFTEYSVCHLCLVVTWNTQVLAEVQLLEKPGRALLLAWPLGAIVLAGCALLWPLRKLLVQALRDAGAFEDDLGRALAPRAARRRGALMGVAVALLLLTPWGILLARVDSPAAFATTWAIYADEWPSALLCAAAAAGGSVLLASALDLGFTLVAAARRRARLGGAALHERIARRGGAALLGITVALTLCGALLPPALVGDAAAAAYIRVPAISGHWIIVSLVCMARFALIAVLAVIIADRASAETATELAMADGAGGTAAFWNVRWPRLRRLLLPAGMIIFVFSLYEVAATQLVRPPGVGNIALSMLNAIHFGRDAQVAAMCLYLLVLAGACAAAVRTAARRAAR